MPITPQQLAKRRKPVAFTYADEAVHLEYYPAAVNADTGKQLQTWMDRANTAETDAETDAILRDFGAWVCTLLASWDYCEDDGVTPQPITPENIAVQLQRFPDFIVQVLLAVLQDFYRGNANGATPSQPSDATSSRTANSTNSPMVSSPNPSDSSSRRAGSTARRRSHG